MGKVTRTPPRLKTLPPNIVEGNAFEHYALYLSMGLEERIAVFGVEKGTDSEFSEKYKIDRKTIWRWKQDDALWKLRDGHLKALKQFTGPVLRALARKAMLRGDAYEVETWMRLVENYTPKQKSEHHVEGLADLIQEDMKTAKDPAEPHEAERTDPERS